MSYRASAILLPVSPLSRSANLSKSLSKRSATRATRALRSAQLQEEKALESKEVRAAAIASDTSCTPASETRATIVPSCGLLISLVDPSTAALHSPSMNSELTQCSGTSVPRINCRVDFFVPQQNRTTPIRSKDPSRALRNPQAFSSRFLQPDRAYRVSLISSNVHNYRCW
jgi:hypothetical protein